MRVALVHDWLTGMRGGEAVLEAIAELFPTAELHTLIYIEGKVSQTLSTLKRHTSFLQRIPGSKSKYRHFLPLMPTFIENLDLSDYDLIVSSSHCVAKGIKKSQKSVHVSYVHAPMRYMWDRYEDYFGPGRMHWSARFAAKLVRPYLQKWDQKVSQPDRVDLFIANSQFISTKIKEFYHRDSYVVHPFADLSRFDLPRHPSNFYLMVTALVPYKRVDLAIEAFNELHLPLFIVGSGPEESNLKRLAGSSVEFLGSLSNQSIAELYSRCKALVFPGIEDFGITPLEAMAAGAPVIAFKGGGVMETVTDKTGLFFSLQTPSSLMDVVREFESKKETFTEENCRNQAKQFSRLAFQTQLIEKIQTVWETKKPETPWPFTSFTRQTVDS